MTRDKQILSMLRVSLTVGLIGRMTVNGAYFICLQYSSEIFPTVIRGQGVGVFFYNNKIPILILLFRLPFARLWEASPSSSPPWWSTLPSSPPSSPSSSLASALSLALSQPSSCLRRLAKNFHRLSSVFPVNFIWLKLLKIVSHQKYLQ